MSFCILQGRPEQHGKSAVTSKYLCLWATCLNLGSSRGAPNLLPAALWWPTEQHDLHGLSRIPRSGGNSWWTVHGCCKTLPFLQLPHLSAESDAGFPDNTSPNATTFCLLLLLLPLAPRRQQRQEQRLGACYWVSICKRTANEAEIVVQSKRQRGDEEIKLHILPQSWSCPCVFPVSPQVQPAPEDIMATLVLPSEKTMSCSVLYKQQKPQKISRLLPSASRISHSWELRDQRQQWRNILFLSYFISALLLSFLSHTSPLLLEVLMTSCSQSTSISGSRNLLAREVCKQHWKERLSSISKQVMRINKVIPSPHCPNLLEVQIRAQTPLGTSL